MPGGARRNANQQPNYQRRCRSQKRGIFGSSAWLDIMGQHLQLYASKTVSLSDAKLWCNLNLREYDTVPTKEQEPIFQKVRDEMNALERSKSSDHQEHWSAGHGVSCFRMLDCEAHACDETTVEKARQAGREHNHHLRTNHPECAAAKHDWENDDAVKFLLVHIGFVVWGYNDGV